jgi:hypothetical protein
MYTHAYTHSWRYTKDHAKVGLTPSTSSIKYVCVGDINRMESQWVRGGGTACLSNSVLWSSLNGAVFLSDSCTKGEEEEQQEYSDDESSSSSAAATGVNSSSNTTAPTGAEDGSYSYDSLACDCQLNPFLSSTSGRRSTVAVCNNDNGWLNGTARCAFTQTAQVGWWWW